MEDKCPICGRDYGNSTDKHHLIPKTHGGKETTRLHKICHRKIHATFTEKELEKKINSAEALLENEEMKKFVQWVQKKPIDYYDISVESRVRKGKRR